jgi:serine/threonine-protein kinase HipA
MIDTCLSCQTPEPGDNLLNGYHPKCSKALFGTRQPPSVPFKSTEVTAEAQKMVGRMSISGIQPKLSVIHDRKRHALIVVDTGGLYILKPQTDRFESLPENENLCMNIASAYEIAVPNHGLLPLKDNRLAYVVKRFDRLEDGSKLLSLFERALLFFVLGNGDAHLKNFSLVRREEIGYQLSPVYDIVNSRLVLPEEKEEMCISFQGKKNELSKKDFQRLSEHFGLRSKQVNNALERLNALGFLIETMIEQSFLNDRLKNRFLDIFRKRMERIFK